MLEVQRLVSQRCAVLYISFNVATPGRYERMCVSFVSSRKPVEASPLFRDHHMSVVTARVSYAVDGSLSTIFAAECACIRVRILKS